ncbi:LacI family DNA-binding transcriptional regulator [Paenibacillus sp. NFR01]|uniref:LacI family DNA-binding transcriptional regulator n=1 Tax=Paenibacillus sp. NFR01 TaxID=1566279 RepID=UPI0008B9C7D4|nr:LacI family DNA-binding transcriptional regulator [Paenibacillus sp. NFR01]SEU23268.1 transcriptional regulator, LacI family [Paenibacillus sp. NFR01]
MSKINIHDVAKKSGLSVVTVSRVLNGAASVRESNRQKVLAAMKALDYHPSAAARSLASGRTGVIGLIVSTLNDSFFDEVVKEVTGLLAMHGYYLAISVTPETDTDNDHYLIREDRVDGMILLSPLAEDRYVPEMKRRGIPYVLIDNQEAENDVHAVNVDNFKGGYLAGRHLIAQGCRSIAHLCGSESFRSTRERRAGFLRALEEAGMSPFEVASGDYDIAAGYAAGRRWLSGGRLPDAVFAGDDHLALGLINALRESGVAVPGEVLVIGYDDQYLASRLRPHLSTLRQPADQIGRAAAELLLKRIGGKQVRGSGVVIEPELIMRESTTKE